MGVEHNYEFGRSAGRDALVVHSHHHMTCEAEALKPSAPKASTFEPSERRHMCLLALAVALRPRARLVYSRKRASEAST